MKCFCCGKKAIVIANTCSPTSSSGMTTPRPWCAFCFVSIQGATNVFEWLIPIEQAKFDVEMAIKYWIMRTHFFAEHKLTGDEKEGFYDHLAAYPEEEPVDVVCLDCGVYASDLLKEK